jgi:deoxycytidylate deaminase
MSRADKVYFRAAKAVSLLSDHPIYKIGCVVVDRHRIISSGCNSKTKCHPLQAKLDTEKYGVECPGKCHAEVSALLPLIRDGVDLTRASIYVFRQHKNGINALARPCSSCMKVIKSCGIRRINYTVEDGMALEKIEYINKKEKKKYLKI